MIVYFTPYLCDFFPSPKGQVIIPGEMTFKLDTDIVTDPPVFTLTSTSIGGPPSIVFWSRDGTPISDNSTYAIASRVIDGTTATYTHTLTVTGRLEGEYEFNVSNIRTPSGSTKSLTVVGKHFLCCFIQMISKKHNMLWRYTSCKDDEL